MELKPYYNQSIWNVPLKNVEMQLMRQPYIKAVRISRRFPSTILVEIQERIPVALLQYEQIYAVDSKQTLLPIIPGITVLDLPVLSGFETIPEIRIGFPISSEETECALSILLDIYKSHSNLYNLISEIHKDTNDEWKIYTVDGQTTIFIGKSEFSHRIDLLVKFLEIVKNQRKLSDYLYVDLRFSKQVIVKEHHL
jgi:cell division protein FtsQ